MTPIQYASCRKALMLLDGERHKSQSLQKAYEYLHLEINSNTLQAGVADFLGNPFFQTALKILEKFSTNPKIRQALRLLQEAGKEAKSK